METGITIEDRFAIEDLLTEFGWLVDHGHADKVAELFTENAIIATPMFKLNGRQEIARQFGERAKDKTRISRHIWTNLRLKRREDGRVDAHMAVQTYVASGESPQQPENLVVGDSLDVLEKVGDVWRFAERRLVIAFAGAH